MGTLPATAAVEVMELGNFHGRKEESDTTAEYLGNRNNSGRKSFHVEIKCNDKKNTVTTKERERNINLLSHLFS